MRAAVTAVDHSRGLVVLRPLGHVRRRGSPPLRAAEPAELGHAPHSLEEALCALAAVEARLCAALRDQERLRLDSERLMQSLEAASRRAVAAQRVAHHDRLTGLPNRLFLIRRLQQAIAAARQQNRQLALLFIDLDGFKAVNDGFGHAIADSLLTAVGSRIAACIRSDDIACRYGGDEFVALLPNLGDISIASGVVHQIRDHVGRSYRIKGHEIRIAASIGLAVFPADGDDYGALLNRADAAMFRDKASRRRPSLTRQAELAAGAADETDARWSERPCDRGGPRIGTARSLHAGPVAGKPRHGCD